MLLKRLTDYHSSLSAIKIGDGGVDERRGARFMISVADHLANERTNNSRTSEPSRTQCDEKPHQPLPLLLLHGYRDIEYRANKIDTVGGGVFSFTDGDLRDHRCHSSPAQYSRGEA